MKGGLFRLAQQSGLYALGNLLLKVAGLALHKFYLDPDLLSSEEYGFLVLLETTAEFGILLAGLGLASGLLKFIADARYRADHDALPFTVLVLTALAAVVALGLFFLVGKYA